MQLPRRLGPENDFDTEREANLLGHDDGSALAAFFVDLRSRMAHVPEVSPSAEVLAFLQTEPLGDVPDVTPLTLASPILDDAAPVHDRPSEVNERRSPWLAAAAIALIAGGGAIWWSIGLAAGSSSSSVSAGHGPTVFEHDTDEAARATVDLGSAGAVTVDRAGRQPLLIDVRPGVGWHLTDQREDGTQLTLASNDREILTVTIVIDDPVLWLEVSSTRSSEVTRLLLADVEQLADDGDRPASAAAENAPADSIVPEPAGAESGVPATGVAPGGGAPSSGTTTTEQQESATPGRSDRGRGNDAPGRNRGSPQEEPATTESSTPAPGPVSPTTTSVPVSTTSSPTSSTSSAGSTSTTVAGSGDDDATDEDDTGDDGNDDDGPGG